MTEIKTLKADNEIIRVENENLANDKEKLQVQYKELKTDSKKEIRIYQGVSLLLLFLLASYAIVTTRNNRKNALEQTTKD